MEEWEVTTNRYRVSFSVGENLQKVVQLDAAELLQILKDDAVKVLHSICRQIWKTQQRPQDWKRSVFIPIPKKGNAKECSNYHTIALFSHARLCSKFSKPGFSQQRCCVCFVLFFANKGPSSQSCGFSSSHVWMWELDHKESWAPKNWRFWTVVLEKTLESPLDYKEVKPVNPNGNQPWIFTGRIDSEAINTLATWCKEPTR